MAEAALQTGSSYPELPGMTNQWPPREARRIPQCFRTHRAMTSLVASCPNLFEDRTTRIEDNVMQWYPATQRPTWVTAWQYQKRQLLRDRETTAQARHASLMASPDMQMSKTSPEAIWKQMLQPPAGSRVPSGAFPHSFGFSNGLVLEDPYYDRILAPSARSASANATAYSTMYSRKEPGVSLSGTLSSGFGRTR
jgi:hypothetical protein